MTSPAQLIHLLSEVTGLPLPTMADIDRELRTAGLRTKNGRGINAARMSSLDAATILTAVLASAQSNLSVETVTRYAETQADQTRSSDGFFAAAQIDDLAALPARHSFVEGIAALITSATTGSLAKLIAESGDDWTPRIEVFAFTRATYGRIRLSGLPNGLTANVEYLPPRRETKAGRGKKSPNPNGAVSAGDLEQSRRITERTILSVASLLAQES